MDLQAKRYQNALDEDGTPRWFRTNPFARHRTWTAERKQQYTEECVARSREAPEADPTAEEVRQCQESQ